MVNLQDFIVNSKMFKKFKVDDLLFAEFKCPMDSGNIFWYNNFFAYVVSGETLLKTPQSKYILKAGDCAFAKKGSVITQSQSHEDFCELIIFVPDSFIRTVIQKHKILITVPVSEEKGDTVIPLLTDDILKTYFHSLLAYFALSEPPSNVLLKLKFEELMVNVMSNNKHMHLKRYLQEISVSSRPSVKEIMEANFFSNLPLNEFAQLCSRSLSAFKIEFKTIYNTTPGKWLLEKRLEYSKYLLETTDNTIDEICSLSGFENMSHFIRVFKERNGVTPGKFKVFSEKIS